MRLQKSGASDGAGKRELLLFLSLSVSVSVSVSVSLWVQACVLSYSSLRVPR